MQIIGVSDTDPLDPFHFEMSKIYGKFTKKIQPKPPKIFQKIIF